MPTSDRPPSPTQSSKNFQPQRDNYLDLVGILVERMNAMIALCPEKYILLGGTDVRRVTSSAKPNENPNYISSKESLLLIQ